MFYRGESDLTWVYLPTKIYTRQHNKYRSVIFENHFSLEEIMFTTCLEVCGSTCLFESYLQN